MPLVESIFREPVVPNPATSTPAQRIAWIRGQIHHYTHDLALRTALGDDHPFGADCAANETYDAAAGIGQRCQASYDEINAAHDAEWTAATAAALVTLDTLRKRVWPLGVGHVAGDAIVAAAHDVCGRFASYVDDELLLPYLLSICQRAGRSPRRRRHAR
jgi:hypothetical protein